MTSQVGNKETVSHAVKMLGILPHIAAVTPVWMQKENPAVIEFCMDDPASIEKIPVLCRKGLPAGCLLHFFGSGKISSGIVGWSQKVSIEDLSSDAINCQPNG